MSIGRSVVGRMRAFARSFQREDGAIAVQAALLAAPLMIAVFGVVDVSRASTAKMHLQDALDAAALAAARSTASTDSQVQAIGEKILAVDLTGSDAVVTSSSFRIEGTEVVASAEAKVTTMVAGLWTDGDMTLGAETHVTRAINHIELALVLDNTGSMSGTKLSSLKTAAKNLVDTLSEAASRSAEADAVKIALVPFSMTVKVGAGYADADWMDRGAAPINGEIFHDATPNRFTLLSQMSTSWGGCVETREAPFDVQDTAPDSSDPETLFTPFFAPDEPDTSNAGYVNNYLSDGSSSSDWKVRQGNTAKYKSKPKSGTNSSTGYVYGPNAGCQMQPVMRLTQDWDALKTSITNMNAVGDTNIPMGLVWGWHALSPNAPFADGVAYDTPKVQKIVLLMTDGENTNGSAGNNNDSVYAGIGYVWQNRLGITGGNSTKRREAMDGRLATLCANMKARGVILYTVRVEVSNGTSNVLRNCASTTDKFYDVQNASQLNSVFGAIAGSIQNLRLAR